MNKQEITTDTEIEIQASSPIELVGKVWVANERNTKAKAIPDAVSEGELRVVMEDRIIEMAWEDRTPFDAILSQFGISEGETIQLMRLHMKKSSFKMWRARVQGRSTKHSKKAPEDLITFKSRMQKGIALNKMPKR